MCTFRSSLVLLGTTIGQETCGWVRCMFGRRFGPGYMCTFRSSLAGDEGDGEEGGGEGGGGGDGDGGGGGGDGDSHGHIL